MQDIENLRTKSENSSTIYNKGMIDFLKKNILSQTEMDLQATDIINSPKVSNLIYKPIFCFTFYMLGYMNLK